MEPTSFGLQTLDAILRFRSLKSQKIHNDRLRCFLRSTIIVLMIKNAVLRDRKRIFLYRSVCSPNTQGASLYVCKLNSVGAKLRYMGYFASLLHPQDEKVCYYFQSGKCLGALETHVLLSFLWSIFCKWPVINVTPQTLKIAVHKIQN